MYDAWRLPADRLPANPPLQRAGRSVIIARESAVWPAADRPYVMPTEAVPTTSRQVHDRFFFVVVAVALWGGIGCGTTTRHGDATLHSKRAIYGPKGHREWSLKLPVIRLTEARTHHFRLRGLPPQVDMVYGLWLVVPETRRQEERNDERNWTAAPWRGTYVSVTVLSPSGELLGDAAYQLGDLYGRIGYDSMPDVTKAVSRKGDYDLVVRVERPSSHPGDRMNVYATAATNDLESPPRALWHDVGRRNAKGRNAKGGRSKGTFLIPPNQECPL
jgi:hypothetical protein